MTPGSAARRRDPGRRPDAARARELPQPRLPPSAARTDPAGAGHLLDLARADVRRRRPARPRLLLRAGVGHLPRDGGGRHHGRGRVPLPAPPARRDAVRRRQRDGARPGERGPRRRDPDRAARHLLPLQRFRRRRRGCPGALLRRQRGRLGRPGARARGPRTRRRRRRRCRDPLGARRPRRRPGAGGRGRRGASAARPPLRAARRERRLCRGVRRHPHAAAGRPRRPGPADQRGARHPPHRARHRAPGRQRHPGLLLPHDGARPRRRHRAEPGAARRRQPAHPGLGQPRGDRPLRGDARRRARRAAGHRAARPLDRGRAGRRPPRRPATPASASTTPARSRPGTAPTWSRSTPRRRGPPAPAATSTPRCSRPPRPTSRRWWSTAGWSSARETPTRSAATWPPRSRGCGDDEHA